MNLNFIKKSFLQLRKKNYSYRNESSFIWVNTIIISIISTFSGLFIFAFFAKIDEVITTRGEIQMIGEERPIKSPKDGIVENILVKEGEFVNKNQLLIILESKDQEADLDKLYEEKELLNNKLLIAKNIESGLQDALNNGAISKINYYESVNNKINIQERINTNNTLIKKNELLIKQAKIYSPINGVVFNIKPQNKNYITQYSETLMFIVPDKNIEAKIFIPNSDMGFINKNMNVEVRVDAYPFTKFGSIKGTISKIGAEALKTDNNSLPKFPAYIKLHKEFLIKDNIKYDLKSGQSISANLILRKKRLITVISDIFSKTFDSLKNIKT